MLRCLRAKVRKASKAPGDDYHSRLILIKDDILALNSLRDKEGFFDAAVMINVLYAVDDPQACLRQANRLLCQGGILAMSTPHKGTDVDALFHRIRTVLTAQNKFDALSGNFDDARAVHRRMDSRIHRDSLSDIRKYLEEAGFEIQEWQPEEYVNSVVVIKAVKVSEPRS
jgi:ubiquinone/menaquinone biosynthesis C-methylase UbiE